MERRVRLTLVFTDMKRRFEAGVGGKLATRASVVNGNILR